MLEIENGMIKQLLQAVNDTKSHQTVNTHHVQHTVYSPLDKLFALKSEFEKPSITDRRLGRSPLKNQKFKKSRCHVPLKNKVF